MGRQRSLIRKKKKVEREDDVPLSTITVKIESGIPGEPAIEIPVCKEDDAEQVAVEFCDRNGYDKQILVPHLAAEIHKVMESFFTIQTEESRPVETETHLDPQLTQDKINESYE
jgi:hypothetical protein